MRILRGGYVGLLGALLAASCVTTVNDDNDVETDAAPQDDGSASGGATGSGGKASGGTSSGGASAGGASAGGSDSGSTPVEAGADAPTSDAMPGDGSAPDAKAADAAADGRADGAVDCSPSAGVNDCDTCVRTHCCAEWLACDDVACAGDGSATSPGELPEFQGCMIAAASVDGGTPSTAACKAAAQDAGALGANTNAIIACLVATSGDAGGQNCSIPCFGMPAAP